MPSFTPRAPRTALVGAVVGEGTELEAGDDDDV
jgi:hypothetical protein